MLGIPRLYVVLGAVALLVSASGIAWLKGYGHGAKVESARWQAEKIQDQQRAAKQAEAARATIAALEATTHENLMKGGDDIEQIRIIQAPARIEIQKQIVERPIYRDPTCRVDDSMLKLVNDARAGRSVRAEAVPAPETGLPGNAATRF